MLDMTESIAPKSDQLNAEDLLSGPRTFTIAEVRRGGTDEQPIEVHLVEFPGRPFKPSKTVRRILVGGWGKDADAYAGRRLTLYRDPAVRFGGQDVGGIRVSHMSDLAKRLTLALTVSRGKRVPYVVEQLVEEPPAQTADSPAARLVGAMAVAGITEKTAALAFLSDRTGRPITSSKQLTADEVDTVLAWLADPPEDEPTLPIVEDPPE